MCSKLAISVVTARAALVGLVLVTLSGCGFHMLGSSPLPDDIGSMNVTYHSNYKVGDPVLVRDARQRLREQGLLGDAGAPATLAIHSVHDRRHITAVTPVRGNVATYALTTTVLFSYSVRGAVQIERQKLSVRREYSLNETQRLASQTERENLYEDMQRQLVNEIFLRIDALNHGPKPKANTATDD